MAGKKINASYYAEELRKYDKKKKTFYKVKNGDFLYSKGRYRTKITAKDLPDDYIRGMFSKYVYGYLRTSGVTDLYYLPNHHSNHILKDDFLFIKYDGKFDRDRIKKDAKNKFSAYKDEYLFTEADFYVWGDEIMLILDAVKKTVSTMSARLELKLERNWNTFSKSGPRTNI